jgi:sugar phosphate isomerase/epimerase
MNRRNFIQSTMTTALFASLESYAKPLYTEGSQISDLKVFGTNWGFDGNVDAFCAKAKAAGYDGIEMWWETDAKKRDELFAALTKHGLDIGFLAGSGSSDFAKNLAEFSKNMEAAATQTIQKPLYINCHSGKDYFSAEQCQAFFDATKKVAAATGISIYHETHRSRIMYSAPITKQYLERNPDLLLTCDLSHWCCVHESLLADQPEAVNLAIARAGHIHARVGHAEGPQVNDPRAPEWENAVKAHFAWWDKIVARKRQEGKQVTILTEFGPPDYMPTLPYTRQAVANQWEINVYMMKVLRERYK